MNVTEVGADVFSQMGGPSKPLWITGQILVCIAIGAIDTVRACLGSYLNSLLLVSSGALLQAALGF